MSEPAKHDIHAYLDELEDIPGTRVFTAARARKGYWLNQFCMTLMKPDNRDRLIRSRPLLGACPQMLKPQNLTMLRLV